jgi:hypothetical protein
LFFSDDGVIRYLLTENSGEIRNREYFLSDRDTEGLFNRLGLITYSVRVNGVQTYTQSVVTDFDNYSGSLGERTPGKEVRVLLDHDRGELLVSLFDRDAGQERVNWVFRGCRRP